MIVVVAALLLAGTAPTADQVLARSFPDGAVLDSERRDAIEITSHIDGACTDAAASCERDMAAKAVRALRLMRAVNLATSTSVSDAIRRRCSGEAMVSGAMDADAYMTCQIAASHWPRARQLAAAGIRRRGVTMAGFYSIHAGMTLSDVSLILGREGEMTTSAIGSRSYADVYLWTAPAGGMVTVSFLNGGVISKSQVGLR